VERHPPVKGNRSARGLNKDCDLFKIKHSAERSTANAALCRLRGRTRRASGDSMNPMQVRSFLQKNLPTAHP
jgi:hypothetical protein